MDVLTTESFLYRVREPINIEEFYKIAHKQITGSVDEDKNNENNKLINKNYGNLGKMNNN